MLLGICFLGLCALQYFGTKAEIDVTFDDAEVASTDSEYFDSENTKLFLREDDMGILKLFGNLTIIKTLPERTQTRLRLTGLSMGQYTVQSGVDLRMKFCDMLNEPVLMGPIFYAFGFTEGACPPEPGTYTANGYIPPDDLYPDTFDENSYQANFQMLLERRVLLSVNIYLNIDPA